MDLTTSPALNLAGLIKSFGSTQVLRGLDLQVAAGEIVALVGPSGCGKTTTLRVAAGLETAGSGTVQIEGRDCTALPAEKRGIGFVFQDYALFPNLSVAKNVAFGLHHLAAQDRSSAVEKALEMVGMQAYADRAPHELSGGQQQRVALARAMAPRPSVLLLDEPLSNLDPQLRRRVRHEMVGIVRSAGAAALWVTHDHDEGLIVSDRVAVMHSGKIRQVGPPSEIWRDPADGWVAAFMGRGDVLRGTVTGGMVRTALGDVPAGDLPEGGPAHVLVRPEDVMLVEGGALGKVVRRHFSGEDNVYCIQLDAGGLIHSRQPASLEIARGTAVAVAVGSGTLPVFADEEL